MNYPIELLTSDSNTVAPGENCQLARVNSPVLCKQTADIASAPNLPLVGWVREATVLNFIPISKSTMWDWIKKGIFPAPTRIGPRVTAWNARSLRLYIEDPTGWKPEEPTPTGEVVS